MEESMAKLLLRAAFALAVVAGLIYFVAWLLKKGRVSDLIRMAGPQRRIHVVESARLGADSYLHLVKVDGKAALVGVGRGAMSIVEWPPHGGDGGEGGGDAE
ncbi:MAG: flagellar biosynthetic protein FliO [Firmicutes bacterium]|jgi:flagellar biogenesis protein FliO|nr:flagellar biosynthetic protein FliO [Bacillota bacterium]MDD4336671.1 flagellar biosynthetic protein FliO [Bacillota bacterium]MDD4792816.1 flagellar biosynthetic protein FliO [Bacillota bacterium]